jgi:serine/threonine-protein kinase
LTEPRFEELRDALAATYTLEREIGRGGMATVYLALDRKHKRQVALKLLRGGMEHGSVDRFLREIRVTARLAHPHILPLLDSGDVLDAPFFVMPYVVGESLSERLDRETRLPIEEAARITLQIADGLAYAHAQGVIHRDIKPANIMLAGRHALVADFGVAKALTSSVTEEEQTQVGLTVGTIAYMSPEQAVGEPYIDSRSDIFSLGAVLYEMLVGEKAFLGANPQAVLARRFAGGTPRVREKRPEVSEDLDNVIARSLALSPDDRFATAGEFEEALVAATRLAAKSSSSTTADMAAVSVTPSLAVLPFDNLSGDPENEYLSDGITEEILTLLSRRRTIRVCARASAFSFKKNQDDIRLIGSRLGVLNVLLGSVRRATDRLRVTARLVDARDGFQIWSERYDRTLADVFEIQDEIGASIAGALNATLVGTDVSPAAAAKPPIDVYDTLLRGRALWNQRTSDGARRAITCFEEVIAAEPTYVAAHAALADAWVTLGVYGGAEPVAAMTAARRAAEAALAIDSGSAEARTAMAFVLAAHDWDWEGAEHSFRQAIALNPQLPAPHQGLATMCHTPRARFDQAVREINLALQIDPISPVLHATLASVLLYARRFPESVAAGEAALAIDAKFAPAHFFLSQAHECLNQGMLARQHGETAVSSSGSSTETLAAFGHVLCTTGDVERAKTIQQSLEERARTEYVSPTHLAQIPIALGDHATAIRHIERAYELRSPDLTWIGVRPAYDPLRGNQAFDDIVRRLGLRSLSHENTLIAGL